MECAIIDDVYDGAKRHTEPASIKLLNPPFPHNTTQHNTARGNTSTFL